MSSKSSALQSFVFAFLMCIVCGFMLTLAAEGLKERKLLNIKVDKQKNILKALGLVESKKKYSNQEIESLYESKVVSKWVNQAGDYVSQSTEGALPLFVYQENGRLKAYAVHYKAYGLWSWVKGYFSLKNDGNTVNGITVYSHEETPGLGGEVEKAWFQDQYKGKKIVDSKGKFVSIGVVKGKVKDWITDPNAQKNYVDGMSGATITGQGMEKYIRETLGQYEGFSKKLRKGLL